MDFQLNSEVPITGTIRLEPNWEGMRKYVRSMARTEIETARNVNEAMGREGIPAEELEEIHSTFQSS